MNSVQVKETSKKILKSVGNVAKVVGLVAASSAAGVLYGKYAFQKKEKPKMQIQPAIRLRDVSIAVNERNEMLIIDRRTGEYLTYQDSVGTAIFGMYAGRLYQGKSAQ